MTGGDFTYYSEVDRSQRISRGVASSQDEPDAAGRPRHSFQEAVEPFSCAGRWKRQAQQKIARPGAHSGQVTGRARQGFVADSLRRMKPPQKMDVFEERIGREHPFAALSRAHYGSIVPNANP